jgi:Tfp pilus assembly protein PilF
MTLRIAFNALLAALVCVSFGHAQEAAGPPYDYFTADQIGQQGYLDIVTSAHTDRIMEYISKDDIRGAVSDVKYTLDRFANHPKGLMMAGFVANITKQSSLAVSYFERALSLYPQYALTHAQYGMYLISAGHTDQGIAKLNRAIEMDPKLVAAYVPLAQAYYRSGKRELGRQAAEKARELGYKGKIVGE